MIQITIILVVIFGMAWVISSVLSPKGKPSKAASPRLPITLPITEKPKSLEPSEPIPTSLRRAFFALKRKGEQLEETQKTIIANQRELKLDRKELRLYAAQTKHEIEKKADELKRVFAELALIEKAFSLSFKEKYLQLRGTKLDLLETAFKQTMQHQRSLLEIGENRLVLLHQKLSQDLTGKNLLLQAKKNSQDAREREMKFYFNQRDFKLYQDRRDLDLNTKEAKLFNMLGQIRNEQRAINIEKRADELREEWEAIENSYQYHMEWLASRERWYMESLQEKGDTNANLYWFTYSIPNLDYKESKDTYGLTPSSYHYYPQPSPDDPLYTYYLENGKEAYVRRKLEQLKQSGHLPER